MRQEAAGEGFYTSPELSGKKYPRVQLLTVEELLGGKTIDCPPFARQMGNVTFKKAPKAAKKATGLLQQATLKSSHGDF